MGTRSAVQAISPHTNDQHASCLPAVHAMRSSLLSVCRILCAGSQSPDWPPPPTFFGTHRSGRTRKSTFSSWPRRARTRPPNSTAAQPAEARMGRRHHHQTTDSGVPANRLCLQREAVHAMGGGHPWCARVGKVEELRRRAAQGGGARSEVLSPSGKRGVQTCGQRGDRLRRS